MNLKRKYILPSQLKQNHVSKDILVFPFHTVITQSYETLSQKLCNIINMMFMMLISIIMLITLTVMNNRWGRLVWSQGDSQTCGSNFQTARRGLVGPAGICVFIFRFTMCCHAPLLPAIYTICCMLACLFLVIVFTPQSPPLPYYGGKVYS